MLPSFSTVQTSQNTFLIVEGSIRLVVDSVWVYFIGESQQEEGVVIKVETLIELVLFLRLCNKTTLLHHPLMSRCLSVCLSVIETSYCCVTSSSMVLFLNVFTLFSYQYQDRDANSSTSVRWKV